MCCEHPLVDHPLAPAGPRRGGGARRAEHPPRPRQVVGPGGLAGHVRGGPRTDSRLRRRRRAIPVRGGPALDSGHRHALCVGPRRHRVGAGPADHGAAAHPHPRGLARRRPFRVTGSCGWAQTEGAAHLSGPDVVGRGDGADELRRPRHPAVLHLLRGDADPDVLPHRRIRDSARGGSGPRCGEVPVVQPVRRVDHVGRGHRPVRGDRAIRARQRRGGHLRSTGHRRRGVRRRTRRRHRSGPNAVPRLHVRVRSEGAAVAAARLAARCSGLRHTGERGVDDGGGRQGRHLRHAALLPAVVPRRRTLFRPTDRDPRGDRHRLRRDPRDRTDRCDALDRLHLDLALRVHHPRRLRADQPGPDRFDLVHGQPRDLHRRIVPGRRVPGVAARQPTDRRLRRRAEGRACPGRHLPGGRTRHAVASGTGTVHQRVPGPHRHVHPIPGGRHRRRERPGVVGDLHSVDLPTHDGWPTETGICGRTGSSHPAHA